MTETHSFITDKEYRRADTCICSFMPDLTRSAVQRLISEGLITVDGKKIKAGSGVSEGAFIKVEVPQASEINVEPEEIPLDIVYEDSDVIVINKERGMTVHPAQGHSSGTLVNALLFHCEDLSGINGELRPGIVHRIDKDTTGLIIAAKNDRAHNELAHQIQQKVCARIYLAVAEGNIKADSGIIDAPIGRSTKDRKLMAVVSDGRCARTRYEVLERYGEATLVRCALETGRTHQIRVHMKHIGHPLVGDRQYGFLHRSYPIDGQALHACELSFNRPSDGLRMTLFAPVDMQMAELIRRLRLKAGLSAEELYHINGV